MSLRALGVIQSKFSMSTSGATGAPALLLRSSHETTEGLWGHRPTRRSADDEPWAVSASEAALELDCMSSMVVCGVLASWGQAGPRGDDWGPGWLRYVEPCAGRGHLARWPGAVVTHPEHRLAPRVEDLSGLWAC